MTDPAPEGLEPSAAPAGLPPPPGPPPRRRAPRRRRGTRLVVVLVAVLLAAGVAGLSIHLPKVIISPGDAMPTADAVHVTGARTYTHRGAVLFLTVQVSNQRPNLFRYIGALLDSNSAVVDEKDILGNQTRKQDRELDAALMSESQQVATKVALGELGYTVPAHGTGAIVAQVSASGPAAGKLRIRDVITAVDGRPIGLSDELGPMVRARPVGATFDLTVDRHGRVLTVPVTTARATSPPLVGQPYIGIAVVTRDLRYSFPVDVKIDTGPVSGPSAGLAFALTILDEMSPGNLTGGRRVAVTGEISSDGSVSEVGGVVQKAVTARRAGAELMLVPAGEVAEARAHAGGLRVVGVHSLDDALAALRAVGGAPPVPVAPTTATAAAG